MYNYVNWLRLDQLAVILDYLIALLDYLSVTLKIIRLTHSGIVY